MGASSLPLKAAPGPASWTADNMWVGASWGSGGGTSHYVSRTGFRTSGGCGGLTSTSILPPRLRFDDSASVTGLGPDGWQPWYLGTFLSTHMDVSHNVETWPCGTYKTVSFSYTYEFDITRHTQSSWRLELGTGSEMIFAPE
jgi:hypothetical protein